MDAGRTSRRTVLFGLGALTLGACSGRLPDLPYADHVVVQKSQRRMFLMTGTEPTAAYRIDLGFTPAGHKNQEGDGRTPEGLYWIDRKNPRSAFHLSLGINYPNRQDMAFAMARGVQPGGDIFIHGEPVRARKGRAADWTAGCIAVTNAEIEQIYAAVRVGTPVTILA